MIDNIIYFINVLVCWGTLLVPIVVVGVIIFFVYFTSTHQEKWCESCNTWQKMKWLRGNIIGWECSKCRWINQNNIGACPSCGWYGKYTSGTISRRGPFVKTDREAITPFWGVQEKYLVYEERIQCPKHGVFVSFIPVNAYGSKGQGYSNDDDDWDQDYGYPYSDDEN